MFCEGFSQLHPKMWSPARVQRPGGLDSVVFNLVLRRCGFATVSCEPESQLQTAQLAESSSCQVVRGG